jgi:hypothetical protein
MSAQISLAFMNPEKGLNNLLYFQNTLKESCTLKQKEWIGRADDKKIEKCSVYL